MTKKELQETINSISDWGDPEICHGSEDQMLIDFVVHVSNESTCPALREMAQMIVEHLDRTAGETRWYA